jgi:hypothetical protein
LVEETHGSRYYSCYFSMIDLAGVFQLDSVSCQFV